MPFLVDTTIFFGLENFHKVLALMSPKDHQDFFCDVRKINMVEQANNFLSGIQRYYVGEDVPSPDSGLNQII